MQAAGRALDREEHGSHALLGQQVGLRLAAVAQHLQAGGIAPQLVDEVAYHGAAALADLGSHHVGETEDPAVHAEQVLEGADHGFATQLGGAVKGDGMGGLLLGDGLALADAVNGGGGGESQAADAVAAHAFEHVVRADGVLPEVFIGGVAGDEFDIGVGGQVVDHFNATPAPVIAMERRVQRGRVQQVAFDETEAGMGQQGSDVLAFAATEVIDDGDRTAAAEQCCGEVRADAARSAGDEDAGGHV